MDPFAQFNDFNDDEDVFKSFEKLKNENVWDCFKDFDSKTDLIMNDDDDSLDGDIIEDDTVSNTVNDIDDMSDDEENMDICSDCKTPTLVYKEGQYLCTQCGLMQQKTLSTGAEYKNYSEDRKSSNPERVGMPTNSLLPESSLGTLISQRSYDNNNIKRMIQYNSWHQMPYKERSLYKICCKITNKGKRFGLPTIIIERAKEFYNIIREVNISRGDNRDGLIAACVYFACKDEKVPRSSKEIANIFDIKLQDMTKGIKNFRENWYLAKKNGEKIRQDSSSPIDYIDRYCSNLPISKDIKYISEFIAVKAIFKYLVDDNTAPSIAAGSIFLACTVTNQNVSKKQVADACKTSEVTISKCFKKLNEYKLELLPKSIIEKYSIT